MRSPNYSSWCAFSHHFYQGSVLFPWISGSGKLLQNISQLEEVPLSPGNQGDSPRRGYLLQDTVNYQKQRLLQPQSLPKKHWLGSSWIPKLFLTFHLIWWLCSPTTHYGRNSCFHNSAAVSHVQECVSSCSVWPCGVLIHHQQQRFHLSFVFFMI